VRRALKNRIIDVETLISRSSLGEPAVAQLRSKTPPEVADAIVARSEQIHRGFGAGSRHTTQAEPAVPQTSRGRDLEPAKARIQMSKSSRNSGTSWSRTEKAQLRTLASQNTPTRVIGLKLGRTENAVRSKASELDISLKPTNQSPYNRRSK
jgi:hypothetical protein